MQLARRRLLFICAALLFFGCIIYISGFGRRQSGTTDYQRHGKSNDSLNWSLCGQSPSNGGWHDEPPLECENADLDVATCGHGQHKVWRWHTDAMACNVRRFTPNDVTELLQHQWIAVVGDSVGRNIFAAFMRLVADEGNYPVVKGHQDFEYMIPGEIKASFIWAPYTHNATTRLNEWVADGTSPDVVLLSLGLWDMLHITSVESFSHDMGPLQQAADAFVASKKGKHSGVDKVVTYRPQRLDFCSISDLHTGKMKTSEKQERMTSASVKAYNDVIYNSGVLIPSGHMHAQDLYNLTQGCGADCTEDGVHYINAVYDAAMQMYVNSLHLYPSG